MLVFPLIMLFLTVLAFNQLGEGLRARSIRCSGDERAAASTIRGLSADARATARRVLRDVSLTVDRRRNARPRRRKRRRQDHDRQGHARHPAAGVRVAGARSASRAGPRDLPEAAAQTRRRADRAHPAGSDDRAQPARRIGASSPTAAADLRLDWPAEQRASALHLLEEVHIRDPERVLRAIRMNFREACASAS